MHPTNWEISELKGIIDHHVGVDDSATFNNSSNPLPLPPSSSSSSSSSFIPYFPFSASSELLNSPNILSWTSGLMEDQLQPSSSLFQSSSSIFQTQEPHAWRFNEPTKTQTDLSSEMEANSCGSSSSLSIAINGPRICREEQKRSCSDSSVSDGYRWRKYGEKQVKGSENPRSYYKCSNPNCSMRKKVERNLEGEITEIEYKGSHNHPKPEACGRNSLIQSMASEVLYSSSCANSVSRVSDTAMREDGSVSVEEEDCFERTSQSCHSGGDEDVFGPQAKRWKGEKNENDGDLSRSVKEPRVVVQTISEIDLLDDGYRWRKYGQKVVKTNPNPRSYYKCTSQGCGVRKHVERAANDAKSVITTYEGKHNHVVPPSRGRSLGYNTNTTLLNGNDVGANPIRPSANYSTFMNSPYNARLPPTYPSPQEPFALEMFHNQAASLGFSGFGRSTSSDTDRVQEDRYTK